MQATTAFMVILLFAIIVGLLFAWLMDKQAGFGTRADQAKWTAADYAEHFRELLVIVVNEMHPAMLGAVAACLLISASCTIGLLYIWIFL